MTVATTATATGSRSRSRNLIATRHRGDRPRTARGSGRLRRTGSVVPVWLFAALLPALVLTACSPGASAGQPTASGPAPTTAAGSSASGTIGSSPAEQLTAALDGLADGYTFETTVAIAGKVATKATGRSTGGSSDFKVESGGASITYRTIPPRSWVKQPGKAWVPVDGGVPDGEPLDSLRRPTTVERSTDQAPPVVLRASYPSAALGLPGGDAPVTVTVSLYPDGRVGARYAAASSAGQATSETMLTPMAAQQPIVAP